VEDGPPWKLNDTFEIEIIGGAPGKEVHSFREAYNNLKPEMKELLFPEPGLLIRDAPNLIKTVGKMNTRSMPSCMS